MYATLNDSLEDLQWMRVGGWWLVLGRERGGEGDGPSSSLMTPGVKRWTSAAAGKTTEPNRECKWTELVPWTNQPQSHDEGTCVEVGWEQKRVLEPSGALSRPLFALNQWSGM